MNWFFFYRKRIHLCESKLVFRRCSRFYDSDFMSVWLEQKILITIESKLGIRSTTMICLKNACFLNGWSIVNLRVIRAFKPWANGISS